MRVAPVSADLLIKAAIALAVVGVVWYSVKKVGDKITGVTDSVSQGAQEAWRLTGQGAEYLWDLGGSAAQAVNPVNLVPTIGAAVGIPRTSVSECARAINEGRTWDASFACDAATFLRYTVGMQTTIDSSKF